MKTTGPTNPPYHLSLHGPDPPRTTPMSFAPTAYKAATDPNALSAASIAEKMNKAEAANRTRAERFSATYTAPSIHQVLDPTERKFYQTYIRSGELIVEDGTTKVGEVKDKEAPMATGFDIFSPEEVAKKEARAKRFGLMNGDDEKEPASGEGNDNGVAKIGLIAGAVDEQAMAQAALDAELLEKAKARAARFGTAWGANVGDDGSMIEAREPRVEPGAEVERIWWKLYLFGCDDLDNHHITKRWSDIGVKFVEWVHDSTALVHFQDAPAAKRAFLGCDLREGEDGTDESVMAGQWRRADVIGPREAVFVLDVRFATVEDVKDENAWKRSVWKKKQNRKRQRGGQQRHGDGNRAKRSR